MLQYTEAEKALIKSNVMIGLNRPLAEVSIKGMPTGRPLIDDTAWTGERKILSYKNGNVASTVTKKAIACYVDGTDIKVAFADSISGALAGTAAFGDGVVVKSGVANAQSSINLINGVLYLAISYTDTVLRAELWTDESGTGESFSKKSDISTQLNVSDVALRSGALLSVITRLGNGNLVLLTPWLDIATGVTTDGQQAHFSTDNGATWTNSAKHTHGLLGSNYASASGSVLPVSDSSFVSSYLTGSAYSWLYTWTDSGANISMGDNWSGWPDYICNESFFVAGKSYYLRVRGNIYKYTGTMPATAALLKVYSNWTLVKSISIYNSTSQQITIQCGDYMVSTSQSSSGMYIAGSASAAEVLLPVKSINVDPIKNGAGQSTVVIDNGNGIYAPDSTGDWGGVIWPNREITIKLGYGVNREKVFTGLIDSIEMRTFLQELTIQSRDTLKRALDQTVTDDTGLRSLSYTDKSPEYIFTDLAIRAGWENSEIHTEASGQKLSIIFTHETYADAMTKLAELFNYEYYAGRDGELYFHYATDRQPESADEIIVLNGIAAVSLARYPVVTDSIRVYSGTGKTGSLYVKDVDYTITEGGKDSAWRIARIDGGAVADGSTVYVSYVYAAWVFEQGRDIFSLGYTIDDADIYASATVLGRTESDAVCHGSAEYASKDYYNVLPQKVLIAEDQTSKTPERCELIAKRLVSALNTKPRRVEFVVVGNPYLWVGDCIMVIESSSTISEIYRIDSIKHTFSAGGSPVYSTNIVAYHYGYAPV